MPTRTALFAAAALSMLMLAVWPGLGPCAGAATLTHSFTMHAPSWHQAAYAGIASDGTPFEIPQIRGTRTIGHAGEPLLPVFGAKILLPPGEEIVSVRVSESSLPTVSSHMPPPAEREYPFSFEGPIPPVTPKAEIYGSEALFPAEPARLATVQTYRGHWIAFVNLFPLRVRPAARQAEFTGEMTLEIVTAPSADAMELSGQTYRPAESSRPRTRDWLERHVINPERAADYLQAWSSGALKPGGGHRHESTLIDPADTFLYVILTSASMTDAYQTLADRWTERGLPATIVDVADVLATYTGRDNQERIRNFILDAYQNWDLEYVLFGADIDGIPDRDCYCYVIDEGNPMETNDLCCELYYQGLDGTWNDDGDNRWGEEGEEDLIPDIDIARTCTDNATQVTDVTTKILRYAYQPVVDECASAALFGEYLWEDTWGGMYMEEIRLGADTWGYETAGIPLDWNPPTHYEMDGSWSGSTYINEMNGGTHMAHHLGHSDYSYNMKVYTSDVPDFTNDGITHTYNFGYSQGCNAGGFDVTDCIHEEFVKSPTGYVAWIGNTRYGFGVHYTTNGSSQYYHRQFADALWAEEINELGAANNDSRVDNVPYIDYESNRWVHYEITAFGDPAMPLWTATPRTPVLSHDGVFVLGTTSYDVTVEAEGSPVAGARVCMWDENRDAYAFGVTDGLGQVTLGLAPTYPGIMHIVVSDANLLVTDETIPIIPDGPYMVIESHWISDVAGGNDDGGCDAGETIELWAELTNIWEEPITGVSATLSCAQGDVEITDDTALYGDFAGGETKGGTGGDHFAFHIGGGCPDQSQLEFTLTIRDDGGGEWTGGFIYDTEAPALSLAWLDLDDSGGDGDGVLEPGESAAITITLSNDGHEDALAVAGTFLSGSGFLTVTQPSAAGGDIAAGGQGTLTPAFEVALDGAAPAPWLIHCSLAVTGDWELDASLPIELPVGGLKDDMEGGEGGWTHEVITQGFVDEWHWSTQRNHTPGGDHSWKFGGAGGADYSNLGDGALLCAPIEIAENTQLTFWHWMSAEVSASYPGYCYDGGIVEMSIDGGAWEQITPEGGYPYLIREGGTPGPFPAETPVFSGAHDWRAESFLVESGGSTVQFRFRFGSDGAVTEEGWYVDDVEIISWASGADAEEAPPLVLHPVLQPNRPNPFSPRTDIRFLLPRLSPVRLVVLDAQGRVLRTLVDRTLTGGLHRVGWDGRDTGGRTAASGVYFYRLETSDGAQTRSMTLLR